MESESVTLFTGCRKPCFYRKYSLIGTTRTTVFQSDFNVFALSSVSMYTRVETEKLIYPLSSLVAEFGGTLGLFIGFSFMTLWDGVQCVGAYGRLRIQKI